MKKKIALLLAAVMTIASAVPMNLFAAETAKNEITKRVVGHAKNQYIIDQDQIDAGVDAATGVKVNASGTELKITMKTSLKTEVKAFRVVLSNAKWSFVDDVAVVTDGASNNLTFNRSAGPDNKGFVPVAQITNPGGFSTGTYDAAVAALKYFIYVQADGLATLAAGTPAQQAEAQKLPNVYVEIINDTTAYVYYYATAGVDQTLTLPLVMQATSDDAITLSINSDSNDDVAAAAGLAVSVGGRGTTNTYGSMKEGRTSVSLDTFKFTEKGLSSIVNGGVFYIMPEDGYRLSATGYTVASEGLGGTFGLTITAETSGDYVNGLKVVVDNCIPSALLTGWFSISGLKMLPIDMEDDDFSLNTALSVSIVKSSAGVSEGKIENVAKFVAWGTDYSAKSVKDIEAGRNGQETDVITIVEKTPASWWTHRDTVFTLADADGNALDNVKITSVKMSVSGFDASAPDNTVWYSSLLSNGRPTTVNGSTGAVDTDWVLFNADANGFSFRPQAMDDDKAVAKVSFSIKLSTAFDAEGEVYLKATNSSFGLDGAEIQNAGLIQVANIERLIDIETSSTIVQIGNQKYNVADIKVTELKKGALLESGMVFQIGEFGSTTLLNSGLKFVPATSSQLKVTTTDKKASIVLVSGATGAISLRVDKKTTTDAAVVELVKVQATIDRTVPNGEYDLFVSGGAFHNNADNTAIPGSAHAANDGWGTYVYHEPSYIIVGTPPEGVATKNEVIITAGSNVAYVNGAAVTMSKPAIYESGAFLVPLRFVVTVLGAQQNAVGLESASISWDNVTRVATAKFNNITAQFQENSNQYYVVGEYFPRSMSAKTKLVYDENGLGTTYIPFRALGNAFEMEVDYKVEDDGTIIGIYNPAAK